MAGNGAAAAAQTLQRPPVPWPRQCDQMSVAELAVQVTVNTAMLESRLISQLGVGMS